MGTTRSFDTRISRSSTVRAATASLVGAVALAVGAMTAAADTAAVSPPVTQDWTNTGLITVHDDWDRVPGFVGYRGQGLATSEGIDPQTITATSSAAADVGVFANSLNLPASASARAVGVGESHVGNATVAIVGTDAGNAPSLLLNLSTTDRHTTTISYLVRDIDRTDANSVQAVALQYRVGSSGPFTNIPAGFVADATTGPRSATQVTAVAASLPAGADNRPLVQVRWITANAVGTDEWVGIDDISVTSTDGIPSVNRPPSVVAGGPYSVDEGGFVVVTATGSDPDGDSLTYRWDLDGNGTFERSGRSTTFSAADLDGPSDHSIAVQVSDPSGATATASSDIDVRNVAPTASLITPTTAYGGLELVFSVAAATDPSAADRLAGFTYAFDCGDGAGYGTFAVGASSSCDTSDTGNRSVRAKIRDQDAGIAEYSATVDVIVTFDSLCELTRQYVSNPGIEHSLCVKLAAAEASYGAGRPTAEAGQLAAYRNQVAAQSGRALTQQQATLLTTLSTEL